MHASGFNAESLLNTPSMQRGLLSWVLIAAIADGTIGSLDTKVRSYLPFGHTPAAAMAPPAVSASRRDIFEPAMMTPAIQLIMQNKLREFGIEACCAFIR